MKIYKVGGYVRDKLLGIKSRDIDYVVVGSTSQEMKSLGFIQVGKDFPVFLHPITNEEFALARSEKKVAPGYKGFHFNASPNTTLIEDLKRRDITINAIAEDQYGNLIDPFNGLIDLKNKIIRHVSDSFTEDPLRVLRVARFSAKFNFIIAPETMLLLTRISETQELLTLSKERIWQEYSKALMCTYPANFFLTLANVGALEQIFPEFIPLIQHKVWWQKFLEFIQNFQKYNLNLEQRFSTIYYFISLSSQEIDILNIIKKNISNKQCIELAILLITYHEKITNLSELSIEEIYNLINALDPIRKKMRFKLLLDLLDILKPYTHTLVNIYKIKEVINQYQKINYTLFNKLDHVQFIIQIKKTKMDIIQKIIF